MPTVYIIAGPNGAGKTTFAREFLPDYAQCTEFLNADLIAAGISPFDPSRGAMAAGRVLLERIRELTAEGRDFAFETTLAGRTYAAMLKRMKQAGYSVELFFLWLPNVDLAIRRVQSRVRQGGHDFPEPDIRRRYVLGIRNLYSVYQPLLDTCFLFDNAGVAPRLIAQESGGRTTVFEPAQHQAILASVNEDKS